jgi:hypothetical protein
MYQERSDHHGHHVAKVTGVPISIDWFPDMSSAERARVREYTCDCQGTYYELCQAGGVRFIRRVRMDGMTSVIHECHRDLPPIIDALWLKLLAGAAQ